MKAIIVSTSFPDDAEDWAGRFVAQSAADLVNRGWQVRALTPPGTWAPTGVKRLNYRTPGDLFAGNGAPETLAQQPIRGWVLGAAATASALLSGFKHSEPDELIIAHWLVPCGLVAVAMGRAHGNPVHLYAHGSDVALLERIPLGTQIARTLDARAQGITFVSEDLRRRFNGLLGRPSMAQHRVAAMGIEQPTPTETDGMAQFKKVRDKVVITTVGRMVPIKGLSVLADALKGMKNVVWLALGDGPDRAELMQKCAEDGIHLISPGTVSAASREAYLRQTDLFVQPSIELGARREGTPVALLEAMAAGVPCVASATGGICNLAEQTPMALFRPGDAEALRTTLVELISNQEARQKMAAHQQAFAEKYLWPHWGAVHEAHLRDSLAFSRCG